MNVVVNQALIQGIEMILGMDMINRREGVEITKNGIIFGCEKSSNRKNILANATPRAGRKMKQSIGS